MCYILLLGTDSPADLSLHNDELLSFSRDLPGLPKEALLEYPCRWYVGSASGCSCTFRHLYRESVDLGFHEPEDWYPEEPCEIEATRRFIEIIRTLVNSGARVECIDTWHDHQQAAELAGTIEVRLDLISDAAFRFYEEHRFVFISGADD